MKTIIVDVIVTGVIVVAVTTDLAWARWAVIIYTPIMLLLKVVALLGESFTRQFRNRAPEAPAWALHVLYAVNVLALGLAQWWLTAAQWVVIWLISFVQYRKSGRSD